MNYFKTDLKDKKVRVRVLDINLSFEGVVEHVTHFYMYLTNCKLEDVKDCILENRYFFKINDNEIILNSDGKYELEII
ncbi:hypothetical protein [Tepidibacter thalassicus]|uniref:Uncharacterized protein n=1 Tax=Tepidibacter thalassicus DSM 15285 TaxID=1123350 RepID=A0A1M5PMZ5_9FIRM|nr:hypothetical protein [Tepidibacter thalassicus]SHH02949.1 hypothetical protein SAMN02744040_00585 [Tepidibacter thalassicus DSM 15285]